MIMIMTDNNNLASPEIELTVVVVTELFVFASRYFLGEEADLHYKSISFISTTSLFA